MRHKLYSAILFAVMAVLFACGYVFAASTDNDQTLTLLADWHTVDKEKMILSRFQANLREKQDQQKTQVKRTATGKPASLTQAEKKKLKQQDQEIANLKKQIASLEQQIKSQEKTISDLLARNPELKNIDVTSLEIKDVSINAWHPEAKCQIISWSLDSKTRTITLTILHRKSQKTTKATAKFKALPSGDRFFLINNLPSGLQVVMPDDDTGTWVVNVDSRRGFVKKIVDPEDIVISALDENANKDDYGGKTFESGEAFLMVKQGAMTIRPPVY